MKKKDPRHRAREAALQILYQWEIGHSQIGRAADTLFDLQWPDEGGAPDDVRQFATALAHGDATTGRVEGFLEEKGKRTELGTLGGSFSVARDINNRGEIVGGSLTEGDEAFHAFIFRGNRLLDLNDLLDPNEGWEVLQAVGINNCGEIVGIGCQSGQDRIVLLRPRTPG